MAAPAVPELPHSPIFKMLVRKTDAATLLLTAVVYVTPMRCNAALSTITNSFCLLKCYACDFRIASPSRHGLRFLVLCLLLRLFSSLLKAILQSQGTRYTSHEKLLT